MWSRIGKDGRTYYIRGKGNFFNLTPNRTDALSDIPDGYAIVSANNRAGFKLERKK